ncbi:hypothetical protein SAMN05216412_102459 [Nitrosospira multiformis]|uniref:Uncharacterized protein n=1 Tax=Nitrosospira multiformis TaxID=1231 RepID=A0A1I0AZN1_9PROT|nr:hypothetical protein SAMN05216412_102459 [Nitrosospira multiformis]
MLQPGWDGALLAICFVRLLAKDAPKALAEGPARRDRAASGCNDRAKPTLDRQHPASRSHLPSEDTAPLSTVAPFASSPFAHLIPQSHRRACEGFVQRFSQKAARCCGAKHLEKVSGKLWGGGPSIGPAIGTLYSSRARMQTGRRNWAKLADIEHCGLGGFECNFGVIAASGKIPCLMEYTILKFPIRDIDLFGNSANHCGGAHEHTF